MIEGPMDEEGFRRFLKKAGKKDHVVDKLVGHVRAFELYLSCSTASEVETAKKQEIVGYVNTMTKTTAKKEVRGLALYYKFIGINSLAGILSEIREREIAKARKVLKLREFRDIHPEIIARLKDVGIVTVEHMLAAGNTPNNRRRLTKQTGISQKHILELVKLSDLSRLWSVKSIRARLYYDAGIDTPHKFTEWEPENLRQMLIEFVKRSGFNGIAPLYEELRSTISMAKKLPKAVTY
jgi:hypothetical protein